MTTKEKIAEAKIILEVCDELREVARNCIERHSRLIKRVDYILGDLKKEAENEPTKTIETNPEIN